MALYLGLSVGLFASGIVASGHLYPDCVNGPLANNTVCDTTASPSDRAKALVAVLYTEEKIELLGSTSPGVSRLGLPSYEWWRMFFFPLSFSFLSLRLFSS